MALTYQDMINLKILDELASVFRDPTSTELLLTSIGFPPAKRPNFPVSGNPIEFWAEICKQIQNGVYSGGFEALIKAAIHRYPSNTAFKKVFKTDTSTLPQSPQTPSANINPPTQAISVPADPNQLTIFLCHSSSDKQAVREMYAKLKNDGFNPWLDEKILPGQNWDFEIKKAVRSSGVVIVFLSNASVSKKGYVQKEIKMALDMADEQPEGSIFIIPLKLEDCEMPDRLSHWQYISYFGDKESAYIKLLRALETKIADA